MPYNPGIAYRGDQWIAQGNQAGWGALGGALQNMFEQQKQDAQKANVLRKVMSVYDPENKDKYTTMGKDDLEGTIQGMGMKVAQQQQQEAAQQRQLQIEQMQREKRAAQAIQAAFQEAGRQPVSQPNPVFAPPSLMPDVNQGMMPPVKYNTSVPVTADRLTAAISNHPEAATADIVERILRAQGGQTLPPVPMKFGDKTFLVNQNTGAPGPEITAKVDRTKETPERIYLKDGTPTQKAMYSDGTVIDLPADRQRSLTEQQANALQYSDRMSFNNKVLADLEAKGFKSAGAGAAIQAWTPNVITGNDYQQYDAARRNWISAVLRKESGAAISKSEETGALMQYFPKFGDSTAVVKQKSQLRQLAEDNMRRAVGEIAPGGGTPGDKAGTASASGPQQFVSEEAARGAGAKTGDVIQLYDPSTATYRKARLK